MSWKIYVNRKEQYFRNNKYLTSLLLKRNKFFKKVNMQTVVQKEIAQNFIFAKYTKKCFENCNKNEFIQFILNSFSKNASFLINNHLMNGTREVVDSDIRTCLQNFKLHSPQAFSFMEDMILDINVKILSIFEKIYMLTQKTDESNKVLNYCFTLKCESPLTLFENWVINSHFYSEKIFNAAENGSLDLKNLENLYKIKETGIFECWAKLSEQNRTDLIRLISDTTYCSNFLFLGKFLGKDS